MSFLNAEWRKLAIANYEIDPSVVKPYLPAKTELDLWNDTCYLSLVGFMFVNTRMLGMSIPFHRTFEEVNLRFYVKHYDGKEWKRGVVFIREIVPKPALTFVANTVYKEHYVTKKMAHDWLQEGDQMSVQYQWWNKKQTNNFSVQAKNVLETIEDNTEIQFITDHYWGYSKISKDKTYEYEVTHPRWQSYPVSDYKIDVDFAETYGESFEFLNKLRPKSVMLAEGSEITVENKRRL